MCNFPIKSVDDLHSDESTEQTDPQQVSTEDNPVGNQTIIANIEGSVGYRSPFDQRNFQPQYEVAKPKQHNENVAAF